MRTLDLASWPRRPHFEFFRNFAMPFWGLCCEVDATALANTCRREGGSFFLRSLWCCAAAVQEVPELRQRIRGDTVVEHEVIHVGSTVLRDDETFGFAYFDFDPDIAAFEAAARPVVAAVKGSRELTPNSGRDDLVFYTTIPWVRFGSFSHARVVPAQDSIPRIVLGRRTSTTTAEGTAEATVLPIAIDVHHALVDGLHVGRFVAALERQLARC
jgi:chloramphenicol O-acetyltransferase type A